MIRELTARSLNELISSIARERIDGLILVRDMERALEFRNAIDGECFNRRHGRHGAETGSFPLYTVHQHPGFYEICTEYGNSIVIATEEALEGHRTRYEKILVESCLWDNIETQRPDLLGQLTRVLSIYSRLEFARNTTTASATITSTGSATNMTMASRVADNGLWSVSFEAYTEDPGTQTVIKAREERKITDWSSKELDEFLESFSKGVTRCSTTP